ncbi:Secreted protein containing DUF1207 [Planctomycetales bacterium 10988]|nr:Secreted protein containing DUF1207 [Planctomycetales bacterium 10988]
MMRLLGMVGIWLSFLLGELAWGQVFELPEKLVPAQESNIMQASYFEPMSSSSGIRLTDGIRAERSTNTFYVDPPPPIVAPEVGFTPLESDAWINRDSWDSNVSMPVYCDPYGAYVWQWLPSGFMYHSYLAGTRESRFASVVNYAEEQDTWLWEIALGGRAPILRYGTTDALRPEGFQLDIEGAAFPRLDVENDLDLVAVDFRFGVPLTYRKGKLEAKFAYYHLSSHLGDEFIEDNPMMPRLNYARDGLVLGVGYYVWEPLRVYAETGWAFFTTGGAEPWEVQFGAEYSPIDRYGRPGAPYFAINSRLREEVDWAGNLVVQAGWQFRGFTNGARLRMGFQYYRGKSDQMQFINTREEFYGLGLYYDY